MRICNVERGWMRNRLLRNPCMARCCFRVPHPASRIPHSIFSIHLRGSLNINILNRDNRAVYIRICDQTVFRYRVYGSVRAKIQRFARQISARNFFFPLYQTTRNAFVARGSHEPLHSGAKAKGLNYYLLHNAPGEAFCSLLVTSRFRSVRRGNRWCVLFPRCLLSEPLSRVSRSLLVESAARVASEFRGEGDVFRRQTGERRLLPKVCLSETGVSVPRHIVSIVGKKIYIAILRTLQVLHFVRYI